MSMNDQQLLRYSRHILLDGFDIAGQERLNNARALVVGAGGLGCPAAMYLAASGVGHITLVDDDVVDLTNLQRQIGHGTADVGKPKAASLAATLRNINPEIVIEPLALRLQGEMLVEQVEKADVVLDCSDNFTTRLAINQACVLHKKPLVSGAAIRSEGQIAVFNLYDASPCYVCLYGADNTEEDLTCSNSGVLAPLVGIIGAMQATEALKIIAACGEPLDGRLLLLDVRSMEWRTLVLKKDANCPVCHAGMKSC
ncbi:MAG TPA: molybdopterin-synthase adenylyltransferase MoeB [Pseudomonadales bacterium]|nr:molybdopterin-synthase adenylyltransferase MoeB [Pseudomonadales bacterium]